MLRRATEEELEELVREEVEERRGTDLSAGSRYRGQRQ